jgi:predicted nucleotidyltransferase
VAIVRILDLRLRQAYGERLRGVYLFGSRARGDHEPDSDVDVLVVLDRIDGYGRDLRRSSDAVSDLSLASGLSISRVLASESSWRERDRPFLRSIAPDAVAV